MERRKFTREFKRELGVRRLPELPAQSVTPSRGRDCRPTFFDCAWGRRLDARRNSLLISVCGAEDRWEQGSPEIIGVTQDLQFSRKPGCAAYTKCPDTHPKPARLGSSSSPARRTRVRARRRRGPVRNSGGRSQPQLQTTYQRPSHQPRRRLRHHPLQPQSGVYTPDKDFLR
jgi:hypothetical protein